MEIKFKFRNKGYILAATKSIISFHTTQHIYILGLPRKLPSGKFRFFHIGKLTRDEIKEELIHRGRAREVMEIDRKQRENREAK